MVFFICSHCGASLKKNKVEKHYAIQCRNAPQVSCMDCHKEFRGNDYVAHTKCITEDEKYSAKGFVPKPNSNKGQCKQQEWIDVVRGVQSQENLPKCLKTVLDSIVKFENIPRKKPKFLNFLKSNHIKLAPHDLDQLWDLLEEEHKRAKENVETSTTNKVTETKREDSTANVNNDAYEQNGDLSVEVVEECETTPKEKMKSKKRKSKDAITDINEKEAEESLQASGKQNEISMDVDQECEDTTKSKKKKKKNKTEAISGSETQENENLQAANELNENISMEVTREVTPKEKTKKKKSKENKTEVTDDTESHATENFQISENKGETIPIEVSEESTITPKSKTKDVRKETGTEVVEDSERKVPDGKPEDEILTKKQKKEKKKREKYEAELKEIENSQFNSQPPEDDDDGDYDGQNRKKKKSKKDKDINGLDRNVNSVTAVQSEETSIKPKKKRHLDDDQSAEPLKKKKKEKQGDEQVEEICAAESVTAENNNGLQKFQWNETILEVVRSKGGEIPVKRLRKKVVAEYQNCCSVESEEKLIVKFNKKLAKVPGIVVHKEIVKLVE